MISAPTVPSRPTDEQLRMIQGLLEMGCPRPAVARTVRVSPRTLERWARRHQDVRLAMIAAEARSVATAASVVRRAWEHDWTAAWAHLHQARATPRWGHLVWWLVIAVLGGGGAGWVLAHL